jgi:hypothetical protein
MATHRGIDKRLLSDVMGHACFGVTDKVYKHLYNRQSAEDSFRKAMGGRERAQPRCVTPPGAAVDTNDDFVDTPALDTFAAVNENPA